MTKIHTLVFSLLLLLLSTSFAANENLQGEFALSENDPYPIRSVVFSSDGSLLAGCSLGGAYIWDVRTHELAGHLKEFGSVVELAFSPDSKWIATTHGEYFSAVHIWDRKTLKVVQTLKNESGNARALDFSRDGKTLAVAYGDNKARLWNVKSGSLIRVLNGYPNNLDRLTSIVFSPDSTLLAGLEERSSIVCLWSVTNRKLVRFLNKGELQSSLNESSKRLAFSADGRTVIVAMNDGKIRFLDVKTGRFAKSSLSNQRINGTSIGFSPDYKVFATHIANGIRLRNAKSGELKITVVADNSFSFAPDGKTLAFVRKGRVHLAKINDDSRSR